MLKIIKLKLSLYFIKDLKWFCGEHLDAFPRHLGFKPWWMHALMYMMCIYIDVSCINLIYETCMMVVSSKVGKPSW
jgi:hypothetical protein